MRPADEDAFIARLRQLGLVELDALAAGLEGDRRAALLRAHADELGVALSQARARMATLRGELGMGPDPLSILDAARSLRAGESGREAAERAAARLCGRAIAARALARLDEAAARLLPRLAETERTLA